MEDMKQETLMTTQALQEENLRLKAENAQLMLSRNSLVAKNQELAEFIRAKLADILGIAKEFRDQYGTYAKYVLELTRSEIGENNNVAEAPKEEGIHI